ncbi:MAG TPA: pseudouridylate synthase, partial [Geobacteraceae bacterium]|nr:pseudouridylate synthase [Geobacteraceae bacterium]
VELPCAVERYPTSRYSLVAASPETGRRHQLRRHFKHLFHPLIGDTKYGEGRHNRFFREELGCARLLLHARELSFNHPVTGEPVALSAPLDAAYSAVLDRLGWRYAVPLRK